MEDFSPERPRNEEPATASDSPITLSSLEPDIVNLFSTRPGSGGSTENSQADSDVVSSHKVSPMNPSPIASEAVASGVSDKQIPAVSQSDSDIKQVEKQSGDLLKGPSSVGDLFNTRELASALKDGKIVSREERVLLENCLKMAQLAGGQDGVTDLLSKINAELKEQGSSFRVHQGTSTKYGDDGCAINVSHHDSKGQELWRQKITDTKLHSPVEKESSPLQQRIDNFKKANSDVLPDEVKKQITDSFLDTKATEIVQNMENGKLTEAGLQSLKDALSKSTPEIRKDLVEKINTQLREKHSDWRVAQVSADAELGYVSRSEFTHRDSIVAVNGATSESSTLLSRNVTQKIVDSLMMNHKDEFFGDPSYPARIVDSFNSLLINARTKSGR
jgi:hypothetical protein